MTTLGCGILAMNKEAAILDRALASIHGKADKIYITVADAEPPSEDIKAIALKYGAELSHYRWGTCEFAQCPLKGRHVVLDFSAARNFNMAQCKEDWYTWLDSDDEVSGMERAKPILSALPATVTYALCTYNYAFYQNGKVSTVHPKERFLRMGRGHVWKGWLHETCVTDYQTDGARLDDIIWNHRSGGARSLESAKRNITVITHEMWEQEKAGAVDPRSRFNLGLAFSGVAQISGSREDWTAAIQTFYEYLKVSGWDEHAYMAWKYVGIGHMTIGNVLLARDAFFEALKLQPGYSDAYGMLGSSYLQAGDDGRAEAWFKLALAAGEANRYASDLATKTVNPLLSLGSIYARHGKLKEAKRHFARALKIVGSDENIEASLKQIKEIERFQKEADAAVSSLKALPESEQKARYDGLRPALKSHPTVVGYRRTKEWKTSTTGREVAIYCGQSWEEWSPDTAKTGIGGSEEAVIYLSQELKKRGWDVTVYGSADLEDREFDGILYRPWWCWSEKEPVDIFIGWRDPALFERPVNAKKSYLWLHDTNPASSLPDRRLENIAKVIVLSKYHRSLYPDIPDDKIMVSANGILPEHFDLPEEDRKHNVIYSSAPDRGLGILLKMWPKIREAVPDAELYWAYGWTTFDKAHATDPAAMSWKADIQKLLKQPGVHELGRIGHEDLAKLMNRSKVWAYPTSFTEIFCITAVKMQAAGVIPVCTNVAALDETVQYGYKMDCRDMHSNPEKQEEFVNNAIKALTGEDDANKEEMVRWARENWTWGKVADQWSEEFKK